MTRASAARRRATTGVRRLAISVFDDERGRVVPVEHSSRSLPFAPVRTFVICNVPRGRRRAEHTMTCDEVLMLVNGSLTVVVRHRGRETRHALSTPGASLFVPEGRWLALRDFAPRTVLLVLASKPYGRRG